MREIQRDEGVLVVGKERRKGVSNQPYRLLAVGDSE